MKVRIMVAALVVAAAAVAAFGATAAKAALPPLSDYISQCVTDPGGTSYIADGGSQAEDEGNDCEASDADLSAPAQSDLTIAQVCIAGATYLYADDEADGYTLSDLLGALNDAGYSAAEGACAGAVAKQPPPNIFLCYSVDQTQPGVWPQDVAAELLKQGYWLPYAVPGNQAGGTNLGGFNLVCNIASTQSVSDSFVGGDGTQLGPAYAGATIGLYPKVGG